MMYLPGYCPCYCMACRSRRQRLWKTIKNIFQSLIVLSLFIVALSITGCNVIYVECHQCRLDARVAVSLNDKKSGGAWQ